MAKTKQQKEKIYTQYMEYIKLYKNMVLLDVNGIKTSSTEELKSKLEDSKYVLIKNTLFKKIIDEQKINLDKIEGSTAVIFSNQDSNTLLKEIINFIKENKTGNLKVSLIEGNVYNINDLEIISKLPSRNELIAKLIGITNSPLYNFLNVINAAQKEFLYTINQIKTNK